jgi:hypothetical protein
MTFVVRPGKYLIEKTRRSIVGVLALVGTGGSIPKSAQEALNSFTHSLAAGHSGKEATTILRGESESIRAAQKRMQGTWLLLSSAGLRWVHRGPAAFLGAGGDEQAIKKALKSSGWNPPAAQLHLLLWGEPGEGRRASRSSKRK